MRKTFLTAVEIQQMMEVSDSDDDLIGNTESDPDYIAIVSEMEENNFDEFQYSSSSNESIYDYPDSQSIQQ